MGLLDDVACNFTPHSTVETTGETSTDVGRLPVLLPDLEVNVLDTERIQAGWTLFSLASAFEPQDMTVVAVDEQGRYRWYYSLATAYDGAGAEIEVVEEGLLIGNAESKSQIASWSHLNTIEPVWGERAVLISSRDQDVIFKVNRSEADRLSNGNTLIHYVWVQPDERIILREVTQDGDIVSDVSTPGGLVLSLRTYRSTVWLRRPTRIAQLGPKRSGRAIAKSGWILTDGRNK